MSEQMRELARPRAGRPRPYKANASGVEARIPRPSMPRSSQGTIRPIAISGNEMAGCHHRHITQSVSRSSPLRRSSRAFEARRQSFVKRALL